MKIRKSISKFLVAIAIAGAPVPTLACIYAEEQRSASEVRADSKPVAVDRRCRMINGGAYDDQRLGEAVQLDDGRFFQVINENSAKVLLGDCNTREVTILLGPETIIGETSCGPQAVYAPLVGDQAPFSLNAGKDLHELVDVAAAAGARELNPNTQFFEFSINLTETHKVGRGDRFDLLCGCKVFYPNSPGAKS